MRDDIVRSSVWLDMPMSRYAPLAEDLTVDVAVIGGGITGLTSAWLLAREGRRVALFERDRLAAGDTARSSAHLTCVSDVPLQEIVGRFGESGARAFWEAATAGIDLIARTVSELAVDCDFRWTPGYLYAAPERQRDTADLRRDAQLAMAMGLDAMFLVSVPGVGRPGVRFGRQAVFQPRCYTAALAQSFAMLGGALYEASALEGVEGSPPRLRINGHTVRCRQVVLATHAPLFDPGFELPASLRERLRVSTTYVVSAQLPAGTHPAALYWDTGTPYDYLRVDNTVGGQLALLGGLDVPAQAPVDEVPKFETLLARLAARMPGARPTHAWTGDIVHTDDGLPLVGWLGDGLYLAAGLGGNGLTVGTAAAMMARDAVLGRPHPCAELFDPRRPVRRGSLWQTLSRKLERWSGATPGGPAPESSGNRPAPL